MTYEKKPCPFCGRSEAWVLGPTCTKATPYNASDRAFPVVRCRCGAEVPGDDWDKSGKTAIAVWNRRAPDARDARIAELEAAGQWGGWMPLDQAPQGELMLFCDMKATELRASFFVDWMVGGKFCGNRHHTATHCMKLPPAPTANALQINDLGEKSAEDTPTATPWYPDDSGEWVEVPEDLMEMPAGLAGEAKINVLLLSDRQQSYFDCDDIWPAGDWMWDLSPQDGSRIVAYKVVKP